MQLDAAPRHERDRDATAFAPGVRAWRAFGAGEVDLPPAPGLPPVERLTSRPSARTGGAWAWLATLYMAGLVVWLAWFASQSPR